MGISLEKKMKIGKGNKSEEHRHEFMLRMHGNLWAANWRDGKRRWNAEVRKAGDVCAQLLGLIPG